MSEFNTEDITDRAGTGKPDLTNGFTINGSASGVDPHKHTESATAPSSPSNGDAWLDTDNDVYMVYIDGGWKDWFGTSSLGYYGDRQLRTGTTDTGDFDRIHYNDITNTSANAADFGNLTVGRARTAGCSNVTYSFRFGGSNSASATSGNVQNTVDYFANATTGNATDFGDASASHADSSGHSDGITGVVWHGRVGNVGTAIGSTIDKYTLATTGNGTDYGDISTTTNRWTIADVAGGNSTRALFWGGTNPASPYTPTSNTIDYITIATGGTAQDFGNMVVGRYGGAVAGAGTADRCLYFGGYSGGGVVNIDYVTVSTTGNASDFGDLTGSIQVWYGGAAANATRAVFHGAGSTRGIVYVEMGTTSNASSFTGLQVDTNNTAQTHSSGAAS